jgi:hypothetical protein
MPTVRRPARITDTWLLEFIANPDAVLWPEVRSMARELLERRRAAYTEAVRINTSWAKLEGDLERMPPPT